MCIQAARPIAYLEKSRVLNENYAELRQIARGALEDTLLMSRSEEQVRTGLHALIDALRNPHGTARQEACRHG